MRSAIMTLVLGMVVVQSAGCAATHRDASPTLLKPTDGDVLWAFPESTDHLGTGGELQIYVDAERFPRAKASFAKFTLGAGGALPPHRHDKTEEIAYILSGEGVVVMFDETGHEREIPVSAGYVWYNPPGAWHAVRNTGDIPLAMVFATIPNEKMGLLSFFRRICVGPGQEGVKISQAELERLGREHDLIFRGTKKHEH